MDSDDIFQIVCNHCACLSIRIEDPLKSSREAIIFCGDCGAPRGTVGTLRDLAVQQCPTIVFPMSSPVLSADKHKTDEPRPATEISAQYAELRRLREQVKIAQWLASESKARRRIRNAESFTLQPSHISKEVSSDKRSWKSPR